MTDNTKTDETAPARAARYRQAQQRRGFALVKIWVPRHAASWIQEIAAALRQMHDVKERNK